MVLSMGKDLRNYGCGKEAGPVERACQKGKEKPRGPASTGQPLAKAGLLFWRGPGLVIFHALYTTLREKTTLTEVEPPREIPGAEEEQSEGESGQG